MDQPTPPTPRTRAGLRGAMRLLVPLLFALAGAAVFHRFTLLSGLDVVQADNGDSRFIAFLIEHWNAALHGQAALRSPPIFYPVRGTLAYSDVLAGMGVVHAGLRLALPIFVALNVQVIVLSLLTFAAAALLLLRGFGLPSVPASLGAAFFAFSWPRFTQLEHIQLQFTPLLPILALLAVECVRDGPAMARRPFALRALAFVALLVLLLGTSFYYAVFAALAGTVALLLCLVSRPGRASVFATVRRHGPSLVLAGLAAAVLAAPLVALYLPVLRGSGGRSWAELVGSLPLPSDLLWMGRENYLWGWWFERYPLADHYARWPELRIGVGAVASVLWVWAVVRAGWTVARAPRPGWPLAACCLILTGAVLQALMVRWPGGPSAWRLVWAVFPGASGIRAVARLELVVTLAMAVGLGLLAADALRARRAWLTGVVVALALLCAAEQAGDTNRYSGRAAEAVARRVAAALPRQCHAAFVIGPTTEAAPALDEAQFDAGAYLAANPDVAANWHASAWEHYVQFGRSEGRLLNPLAAVSQRLRTKFYNDTIPLAATLAGVPVVNGLSGWAPPGWALSAVLSPGAPAQLATWLAVERVPADWVCTVAVALSRQDLPDGSFPDVP